ELLERVYDKEPEYATNTAFVNEFEVKVRWKSEIGLLFRNEIINYIKNKKKYQQTMYTMKDIMNATAEEVLRMILAPIKFEEISIEFNNQRLYLIDFHKNFNTSKVWGQIDLRGIDLQGIDFSNCLVSNVNFAYSDFSNAKIQQSHFLNVNFCNVNFSNSHISLGKFNGQCNISNINLTDAYLGTKIESEIRGFKFNKLSYFQLIKKTINRRSKRKYSDLNIYNIEEVCEDKEFIAYIKWYQYVCYMLRNFKNLKLNNKISFVCEVFFTKCWTSYWVLAMWAIIINLVYALIYWIKGTAFIEPIKDIHKSIYYSVITFTTLGYGEIHPNSTCTQYLVISEVIIGYIILAIFVMMIGNKVNKKYY
ncbi:ion channel, partial [Vallitalea guaymasensis]|uniref:ion channel n=1 Tax=Vallitalea guaymasensis TaxID=1185412 RepID=UPI00272D92E0